MKTNSQLIRNIWMMRWYYFILYAGVGCFLPFVYLYMQEDLGFSNAQIGILGALGPAVMVFVQPFWGWLTDLTGRPDRISFWMNIAIAVSIALLLQVKTFPLIVLCLIVYNLFYSSLVPIFDSVVFQTLDGSRVGFGQIRWFGSFGFALVVLAAGRIIEWTSEKPVMWGYVAFSVALAYLATRMPVQKREVQADCKLELRPLFRNRELMVFLLAASLVIGSNAINYTFFSFLMRDLGGGEGMLGLAMMISAMAEIPFLILSVKLVERFSIRHMLLLAFGVTALRWFLNSIASSPYHLLGLNLLHSLTFGLLYASAVVYVDRLVPDRLRASGQTLFWAATYGLGNVAGNLAGGWVFEFSSVQTLFQLAGVAALAGTLVMGGEILLTREREKETMVR